MWTELSPAAAVEKVNDMYWKGQTIKCWEALVAELTSMQELYSYCLRIRKFLQEEKVALEYREEIEKLVDKTLKWLRGYQESDQQEFCGRLRCRQHELDGLFTRMQKNNE